MSVVKNIFCAIALLIISIFKDDTFCLNFNISDTPFKTKTSFHANKRNYFK